MQLEWAIVGGGIHGIHFASHLITRGIAKAEDIRIFDPAPQLLTQWRKRTAATGMQFLRSASVHHVDVDPWSLDKFAGGRKGKRTAKNGLFAPPYARPALELFNAHCDHVIEIYGLKPLHIQERVISCEVSDDSVSLTTDSGHSFTAANMALTIGGADEPARPTWAEINDPRITHIFETSTNAPLSTSEESVAVIGGGITAAQVALRLAGEGARPHLISRHPLRQHQFDSDPGWLGPKNMKSFSREKNPNKRRMIITKARHRGSVPPDVKRALHRGFQQGDVQWHENEVESLTATAKALELKFKDGAQLDVSRVILATGFKPRRPGGAMIDKLAEAASLPCAECGFPIVDRALRWHPRIFVTGPLAELEIGPVARNIVGAQRACDRIMRVLERECRVEKRRAS